MKRCSKCGEWKEETEYSKCSRAKDGLAYSCKECYHNLYIGYKETAYKKSREWVKKNPEKRKAICSRHNKKVSTIEYKASWYQSNKERLAPIYHRYYLEHRDRYVKQSRLYYISNKDKAKENHRIYAIAHKEELMEKKKEYYKINKTRIIKTSTRNGHKPESQAARYINKYGMSVKDVPRELIDLKAAQIRLFRAVRDKKMGVQEHDEGKEREGDRRDSVRTD